MNLKNNKSKILILILALTLAMVSFAGCGDSDSNSTAQQEEVAGDLKVSLELDFPDSDSQLDVDDVIVGLPDGSSVLDLLFTYANDNNLEVVTDEGEDPYVISIGGVVAEGDAGWMFNVNDETVLTPAGKTMLKDGDEVSFEYTTFGDD